MLLLLLTHFYKKLSIVLTTSLKYQFNINTHVRCWLQLEHILTNHHHSLDLETLHVYPFSRVMISWLSILIGHLIQNHVNLETYSPAWCLITANDRYNIAPNDEMRISIYVALRHQVIQLHANSISGRLYDSNSLMLTAPT